jgi:hypothetical protein
MLRIIEVCVCVCVCVLGDCMLRVILFFLYANSDQAIIFFFFFFFLFFFFNSMQVVHGPLVPMTKSKQCNKAIITFNREMRQTNRYCNHSFVHSFIRSFIHSFIQCFIFFFRFCAITCTGTCCCFFVVVVAVVFFFENIFACSSQILFHCAQLGIEFRLDLVNFTVAVFILSELCFSYSVLSV